MILWPKAGCKRYEGWINETKNEWSESNRMEVQQQCNEVTNQPLIHDFVSRIQFHFSECSENEWMKEHDENEVNEM